MIDWLGRYECRIWPAGPAWAFGYRHKVVLHTTETQQGSGGALIRTWDSKPSSGRPHFLHDGDRIVQLLPLTAGAFTLENPAGGVETNRGGAIQVESTGYARDTPFWTDERMFPLARLITELSYVFPLNLELVEPTGGAGQVRRMSIAEWVRFDGVTTHARVPEQPGGHWDPGALNLTRLLQLARSNEEDDMAGAQDILERLDQMEATLGGYDADTRRYRLLIVHETRDGRDDWYVLDGMTRQLLPPGYIGWVEQRPDVLRLPGNTVEDQRQAAWVDTAHELEGP